MSPKISRTCLIFSMQMAFLLFWLQGFGQYNFSGTDQLLQQNKKILGNNFVVLVWKDGKIVYQKQTPDFTAKTQTQIGNAGNWLTAALIMSLVDEGKLSLDDKVSKYIPIFSTYMKNYITLRNCLTHTTGIQSETGALKVFQKSKYPTLEEEVIAFASKREIEANPGTEFFYSNIGPDIAGRVAEIVTKKSFDRLIQERILRPLKMRGTNFTNDDGGAISPSGGAKSTANDYINFLTMMLNKGSFEGKKVLSEKSVAEMETAQFAALPVKYIPKSMTGLHYGLGSWIMESDGEGKTTVSGCQNLGGSLPYIDHCKNYAAILLLQTQEGEIKKDFYSRLKETIDGQFNSTCK